MDKKSKDSEFTDFRSKLEDRNTPSGQPAGVSTVPPTAFQGGEKIKIDTRSLFSDYHLTVRLRVHLERRQISLLLGVLNYQAVHYGVNFSMYVCMLHLYELLLGSKVRASEVKDLYERKTVEVTQVLIRDLAGKELDFEQKLDVTERTKQVIIHSGALISRDTYKSRLSTWRPERLLSLATVPVDVHFERNGTSIRYSSYCKGYGEGTGTARKGKTARCFELDGEEHESVSLGQQLVDQDLKTEVFLIAHYEWLKRFGAES